ncbi:MAG: sigma 54-interacting transcriptional regulator [Methylobacteriaceae bacterium]|nr:sigma 54-interacting transcriptional regulator [Methylobacteriaceae bacterium]
MLLAQGRNSEAEKTVRAAVRKLESGGEPALLAEALTTHGIAQARLGKHQESRLTLERAIEVAEQAGNPEGAGLAALALIEELGERLTPNELDATYERADTLLANSQQLETLARLRACARLCLAARQTGPQEPSAPSFIYRDQRTAELLREARAVAASEGAVLLTGETGTGKELLARLIHQWSGRRGEFVTVDCAALTAAASESQLFGPSGAVRQAAGGTLFLDEVAALGAADQSWLLRLIERGEILSDGATRIETVDVRIIAASARNLTAASSGVRSDLFYRLNALQIEIPPLRERPEDIPALAEHFIKETRAKTGKRVEFMPEAVEAMRRLPLPGNVRQLRSLIQQTVLTADTDANVTPEAVEIVALRLTQKASFADPWEGFSLDEEVLCFEGKLIRQALAEAKGSITHAARLLGITYQGLAYILQNRQRGLLPERTPAQRRRRSIIKIPYRKKKKR